MSKFEITVIDKKPPVDGAITLTYVATAKEVGCSLGGVGVWTDGIGVYADNEKPNAMSLVVGDAYRVSIEKILPKYENPNTPEWLRELDILNPRLGRQARRELKRLKELGRVV